MAISKKDILFNYDNKIIAIEQQLSQISIQIEVLSRDFRQDVKDIKKEYLQDIHQTWKKLDSLDKRMNDNFKYIMGTIIALFSGLFITAFGDMLSKLIN